MHEISSIRHRFLPANANTHSPQSQAKPQEALLSQHDFQADYPRYPGVESVRLSEDLLDLYIDMTPCKAKKEKQEELL